MAFASLFTLLDDITAVLDDVSAMTKVAAKKTAGLVGDDLAVNANQVTGVAAKRELPVVWAVTKGSFINKAIIIPAALIIAYFLPIAIVVLLMIGGAYLAFEGMEKVIHTLQARRKGLKKGSGVNEESDLTAAVATIEEPYSPELEKSKIRGAIRTDFILSAEIIIIAMSVVADTSLLTKTLVMVAIGVGITIFVYGLVALIVKIDDFGFWLLKKDSPSAHKLGHFMIAMMPKLMATLGVVGTIAMFLVGGGIFTHNWPWLHELVLSIVGDSTLGAVLMDFVVGMIVGLIVYLAVRPFMNLERAVQPA